MRTSELNEIIADLTQADGPFPVAEQVIDGVKHLVFANEPLTLRQLVEESRQFGDRDFMVHSDQRLSFNQTSKLAFRLALSLYERFHIKPGERVAIAMRNRPEAAIAFLAITSLGAIVVPLNAWGQTAEFAYTLEDSGAKLIIADHKRLERIRPLLDKLQLQVITVDGESSVPGSTDFDSLLKPDEENITLPTGVKPDDLACIMYTSGSSGRPKGVMSTHRQILTTVTNIGVVTAALNVARGGKPHAYDESSAMLLAVPLFHVSGCHTIFLAALARGAKLVFMYKWDAGEALKLIEREKITSFSGVPTMSMELINHPERRKYDLSSLGMINAGGAARPARHVELLARTLPGAIPTTGYGLTESNALGCFIAGPDYLDKPTSVGMPAAPLTQVKITDQHGMELPAGETGEIRMKSSAVAKGYWNSPAATAETFRDGWLRTGDTGYLDKSGFLHITGRIKDLVIRGGENISCLEVETAILEHPHITEAAVFSLPDQRLGEIAGAAVSLKINESMTADELKGFLSDRLAAFKVPAHISFSNTPLPQLASGKVDKRRLRTQLMNELNHLIDL